jgi:nitrogen fixation NifU-like protein
MKTYYPKKVIERFLHPKHLGKIKDADGISRVGNPVCGDIMEVYIKVGTRKGKKIIRDVKFQTLGCAAALASSDVICQLAKGKTLDQASKINHKDVVRELGQIPSTKVHCSHLAVSALKAAINDYKKHV